MHSECLTGDVLGSARCDCGKQLDEALQIIGEIGGVLLYLRQEGRGIGLYKKLDAYVLQDAGADTFRANELVGRGADERDYLVGAQMLGALEITQIRLLTNNMDKVSQLQRHGIDVESALPTSVFRTPENERYLQAKADIAGHTLLPSDGRLGGRPVEPIPSSRQTYISGRRPTLPGWATRPGCRRRAASNGTFLRCWWRTQPSRWGSGSRRVPCSASWAIRGSATGPG